MRPSQTALIVGLIGGIAVGIGSAAIGLGVIFGAGVPWFLGLFAGATAYAEFVKVRGHANLADGFRTAAPTTQIGHTVLPTPPRPD